MSVLRNARTSRGPRVTQRADALRFAAPAAAKFPIAKFAAIDSQPQVTMQEPQLPPTRERTGAPRRGADNTAPQPPGVRGFRDITADADDLGRAAAQANRAARKTYANVPSPSPEFDRIEPSLENRDGDPDAPYSYDELIAEAERYAPQPPVPRSRVGADRDREAKKPAAARCAFPFKSAIAIGIVLILAGAGILWGKSVVNTVSGLFKSSAGRGGAEGQFGAAVQAEDSRSRRPAVVAGRRSRRWRSASCCMTRTRPIRRASNMSAR